MTKKITALFLSALLAVALLTGCARQEEMWISVGGTTGVADQEGDTVATTGTGASEGAKRTKTTTVIGGKTTVVSGVRTRTTRAADKQLTFTPVADAGANYTVKGTVSIAVDTVRPTDYDAMFDIMMKLYPDIKFEFEYWTHNTNDDGREYLTTRMRTGTAANIMWDEAGELPNYVRQGWIYPITKYVSSDPEAKNIPANLKSGYTYCNELYAVPHQATFDTFAFNQDLMKMLNLSMPKLEWSFDEYEKYLRAAANGFDQGKCIGVQSLPGVSGFVDAYYKIQDGNTIKFDGYKNTAKYSTQAAVQIRDWRTMAVGVEGWYASSQTSGGQSALLNKLGISDYLKAWSTGKALMETTMTVYTEKWTTLKFNWKQWTIPNIDGKMSMHVDHCFITSTTPADRIDACFQALRFMTYSTNGNLARLTMYEDSQKGKYNLNSHVYYPTTTSKAVQDKFKNLSCTNEVDVYLMENIPNCYRGDLFKLVPEFRDLNAASYNYMDSIYDGLDDGSGLTEFVKKFDEDMKTAWADYEKEVKSVQQKFNASH